MSDARIHIHHAEALDFLRGLPAESIDAVLTDPPYCSGGFSEAAKKASPGMISKQAIKANGWFCGDTMTTGGLLFLLRSCMVEFERILKPGCSALVFCDWRMLPLLTPALESSGMQYRNLIVWDKGCPAMGNGFRPQHELIMHFCKGKPVFHTKRTSNVMQAKRIFHTKRLHQTEKPADLLNKLLDPIVAPGGTVLDPFMGSGSLAAVCQTRNLNFIGCDRSAAFCETARVRVGLASTPKEPAP